MGGNYSCLPEATPNFKYFFIYFWDTDTIKLAFADDCVIGIIRQAIVQCWFNGIQMEQLCDDNSYEIKLCGNPFKVGGSGDEAIQMKRFCCKMLADLRKFGWTLITTSNLSRTDDRSTLFFQRNSLEHRETPIICLSLSSSDSLQLINAPKQLKEIFKDTIHRCYWLGVQCEIDWESDYEIQLRANPWHTSNYETSVCGRKLLLDIVHHFEQSGYLFYGTANFKETTDSLFFLYDDQHPAGRCGYIMVSLNQTDSLRLFDCPKNLIDATRSEIIRHWRKGLQNEGHSGAIYEFQMKGNPWEAEGIDTVWSRFFILNLLQQYVLMGWCLVAGLDITRKTNDKSVFIFKSCHPASLPHFCISLNETNKFRLINASNDIVSLIRHAISRGWPQGIKDEYDYCGSYQFALHGQPFGDRVGNEFLLARCMMLFVLKSLMERGWRVICSADVSSKCHSGKGGDYSEDVHSWFVAYTGMGNPAGSPANSAVNAPSATQVRVDSDGLPTYAEASQQ